MTECVSTTRVTPSQKIANRNQLVETEKSEANGATPRMIDGAQTLHAQMIEPWQGELEKSCILMECISDLHLLLSEVSYMYLNLARA